MSESYSAIYRGSVYDIADPERRGRLRILVPQVLGDVPSSWAEPTVTPSEGFSPVVGDRMWVQFEGGDINRPTFVSRPDSLDKKVTTFHSTSENPPSATAVGDIWVVIDMGNKLRRASAVGSDSWVDMDLSADNLRDGAMNSDLQSTGSLSQSVLINGNMEDPYINPVTKDVDTTKFAGWTTAQSLVVDPTNLVPNPSFEHNGAGLQPTGWFTVGNALPIVADWVDPEPFLPSGYSYCLWQIPLSSSFSQIETDYFPATPGQAYSVMAHIKQGNTATNVRLRLMWHYSDGEFMQYSSSVTQATTTSWAEISIANLVAPSNAAFVSVQIDVPVTTATNMTVHLDAVMLSKGTTVPPYADGETENWEWSWTGEPHNSSSGPFILDDIGAGGVISPKTDPPIAGTRSLRLTMAGENDGQRVISTREVPVSSQQHWVVSCLARASRTLDRSAVPGALVSLTAHTSTGAVSPASSPALDQVEWTDIDAVEVATANQVFSLTGVFSVPFGHTEMLISVQANSALTGGGWSLDIDEFQVHPTETELVILNPTTNEIVAEVTAEGNATFNEVTSTGPLTVPDASSLMIGGESLQAVLDRLPRGLVLRAYREENCTNITSEYALMQFDWEQVEARRMRFVYWSEFFDNSTAQQYGLVCRYTYSATAPPADPTNASPGIPAPTNMSLDYAGDPHTSGHDFVWMQDWDMAAGFYKFRITARTNTAGTVDFSRGTVLLFDDGPPLGTADNAYYLPTGTLGTLGSSGVDSAITATPTKKTYTKTWSALDTKWWSGGGTLKGSGDSQYFGNTSSTGEGNRKSAIWFDEGNIRSTLSGATVLKVELYLYLHDGGNNNTVAIGSHKQDGVTSVWSNISGKATDRNRVSGWDQGTGKWVNLTWELQGWKTDLAGVIIGPGPTDSDVYAAGYRGATHSLKPKLKITYEK